MEGKIAQKMFSQDVRDTIIAAGYPIKADSSKANIPMVLIIWSILSIIGSLSYGPLAAWLVELFPTRIRYTSMSLPYHIGNGWFGGFVPTIGFAIVIYTGNIYSGLIYPIVVAAVAFIVGMLCLQETKDIDLTRYDINIFFKLKSKNLFILVTMRRIMKKYPLKDYLII